MDSLASGVYWIADMHIGSANSGLGSSKQAKRRVLRKVVVVAALLAIFIIGAYSVYHYGGAGVAFNQKHASHVAQTSQKLQQLSSSTLAAISTNSTPSQSAATVAQKTTTSQPTVTAQSNSMATSSPTVASTLPVVVACSSNPTRQAQASSVQAQLNVAKQQQSQLSQNLLSGLVGGLSSATIHQEEQQLQAQIITLTSELQSLTTQLVTC